tara:strand:+ start:707 stop:922 length:216 start_codon:yes stop_codon:yes gene_type:complete
MDYSFQQTTFVCVNSPSGPKVIEVSVGTSLSTIHPVTQHIAEDEAVIAAKVIDKNWQPSFKEDYSDIPTKQ